LAKDYAAVDHAACAANPTSVDVTPNGPLTLCNGIGQLLTATPFGGTGDDYQWLPGWIAGWHQHGHLQRGRQRNPPLQL